MTISIVIFHGICDRKSVRSTSKIDAIRLESTTGFYKLVSYNI